MKEPAQAINKVSALTGGYVNNVKSYVVLSKRSLIHSRQLPGKNLIIPEAP